MHKILAKTLFIGKQLVYLPTCHSTNEFAQGLLNSSNPFEGALVVTNHQTAGKGQRGNVWEAEKGQNLTFSIILKPNFLAAAEQFFLNMAVSNALVETIAHYLSEAVIKWPNDLLIKNRKLCGLLIENSLKAGRIENSIIGIGLNVNQVEFQHPTTTSLKLETNQEVNLADLLERLALQIEKQYLILKNGNYDLIKSTYLNRLFLYQKEAVYRLPDGSIFSGTIVEVETGGRLVMNVNGQTKSFDFKEVVFVY